MSFENPEQNLTGRGSTQISPITALREQLRTFFVGKNAILAALIVGLVSVAMFFILEMQIIRHDDLWLDEWSSLILSDPHLTLAQLWKTRLYSETNPPGYYVFLHAVLKMGLGSRISFILLNAFAAGTLLSTATFYLFSSGLRTLSLFATSVVLLSAPLLAYVPEGRTYLIAMCICYAVTAFGISAIRSPPTRLVFSSGLILAAAAPMFHIFGCIYACAFGTALTSMALFEKRFPLAATGVALTASSVMAFIIYLIFGGSAYLHAAPSWWAKFDLNSIGVTLWWLRLYVLQWKPLLVLFPLCLVLGAWAPKSRPAVLLLSLTAIIFFGLPFIVSFKVPIFIVRYLLIGVPGLLLMFLYIGQIAADGIFTDKGIRWRVDLAIVVTTFLIAVAVAINGYPAAMKATMNKPTWSGRYLLFNHASDCRDQDIRVMGVRLDEFIEASKPHSFKLKYFPFSADEITFPTRPTVSKCPILGWGEHILLKKGDLSALSDAEVLRRAGFVEGPNEKLVVARHLGGFVIVRPSANSAPTGPH